MLTNQGQGQGARARTYVERTFNRKSTSLALNPASHMIDQLLCFGPRHKNGRVHAQIEFAEGGRTLDVLQWLSRNAPPYQARAERS